MIGSLTTLNTSVQSSHHFGPSYSINNDTAYLQKFIADIRMIHKSICKCCGRIGKNAYASIIHGPKFLPPSIKIKMNQLNSLHGEELNEPSI